MKTYERILNIALPVFSVAVIIVFWAIAANGNVFLPSVKETLSSALALFKEKAFYKAFFGTLSRTLIAFLICFLTATATSFLSYRFKLAERALLPVVVIVRVLPTLAIVLFLLLWTKHDSSVSAIVVTSLVVFPTLHENLYSAFCGIDKDLLEMCSVFGVKKADRVFKVVVPHVAPDVISAIGAGLTLNLKLMVAAEVVAHTPKSLGYMLIEANNYFAYAEMMALVLISVVVGLVIGIVFKILSKIARKPV